MLEEDLRIIENRQRSVYEKIEKCRKENERIMANKREFRIGEFSKYVMRAGTVFAPYLKEAEITIDALEGFGKRLFELESVKKLLSDYRKEIGLSLNAGEDVS